MNTSTLRQRIWRAVQKNDWKYVSRTEDENAVNTTVAGFGVATGLVGTIMTAYYMDEASFVSTWYMSACVGYVSAMMNAAAMYTPWGALAFYGTGVPVWAVRKWKNTQKIIYTCHMNQK